MTGNRVLQRRPEKHCAGQVPIPSGVLRQSKRERYSDWPESRHLVKSLFTVFTAFSALPFDCGYRGDDVVF